MITNMICLIVLLAAGYALAASEEEFLENRYLKNPDFYETVEFWKGFLSSPVRASALAVVLICQELVIVGIILTAIILFVVSYYLAKNELLVLDWEDAGVNKGVEAISVAFAAISLINTLSNGNILISLLGVVVASVLVTATVALIKNRERTN